MMDSLFPITKGFAQYFILLPILYLGIVTSIEDYLHGKIYKRHILLGLGIGTGWYLLLALFYFLFADTLIIVTELWPRVIAATLSGFLLAASLWWFNVWSAADAKLFIIFTFLLPLNVYHGDRHAAFTPFVLLVNTYSIAFFFITADFLWRLGGLTKKQAKVFRTAEKEKKQEMLGGMQAYLKENAFGWLKTFLGLTLILTTVRLLRSFIRDEIETFIHIDDTLLFLALFLAFRPLHKLFQIRIVAVFVVLALFGWFGWLLIEDPSGASVLEVFLMGAWALGLMTFRQIYTFWSKLVETKTIPLEELQEHMILSQKTKNALVGTGIFTADEMKDLGVEGLDEESVTRILELYENEEAPGRIEIEKTIAFAPYIFAGLLATFIAGDVLVRLG